MRGGSLRHVRRRECSSDPFLGTMSETRKLLLPRMYARSAYLVPIDNIMPSIGGLPCRSPQISQVRTTSRLSSSEAERLLSSEDSGQPDIFLGIYSVRKNGRSAYRRRACESR